MITFTIRLVITGASSQLEKIRQSGLYLDTDAELAVTSTPTSVARLDAERWIWAATRVLSLLEKGAIHRWLS